MTDTLRKNDAQRASGGGSACWAISSFRGVSYARVPHFASIFFHWENFMNHPCDVTFLLRCHGMGRNPRISCGVGGSPPVALTSSRNREQCGRLPPSAL